MSEHHDHAVPFKVLVKSFIALLALTVITVAAALIEFSDYNFGGMDFTIFNIILAMVIAVAKATVVATFFMGLYKDKAMNIAILFANLTFLFIFFFITVTDFHFRGMGDQRDAELIPFESPVTKANGGDEVATEGEEDDWDDEEEDDDDW
jgi:cytochrome c oxidase subunit 4